MSSVEAAKKYRENVTATQQGSNALRALWLAPRMAAEETRLSTKSRWESNPCFQAADVGMVSKAPVVSLGWNPLSP